MEHWPPEFYLGCYWGGLWCIHPGRQHPISVLWHVEDHFLLAHRRYGPVQHQLSPLWRAQVLVSVKQRCRYSRWMHKEETIVQHNVIQQYHKIQLDQQQLHNKVTVQLIKVIFTSIFFTWGALLLCLHSLTLYSVPVMVVSVYHSKLKPLLPMPVNYSYLNILVEVRIEVLEVNFLAFLCYPDYHDLSCS